MAKKRKKKKWQKENNPFCVRNFTFIGCIGSTCNI